MRLSETLLRQFIREEISLLEKQLGMWDRIRMRREKGLPRKKPGQKGYPTAKAWKKLTKEEFDFKSILSSFGVAIPGLSEYDEETIEDE